MKLLLRFGTRLAAVPVLSSFLLSPAALAHDEGLASAGEAHEWLPMTTYREYSREVCLDLPGGVRVDYRLSTPHPLDMDFHHHTDEGTDYLLEHRVPESDTGSVDVRLAGHYCFRFKNTMEPPEPFSAELHYQVL